MTFPESVKDIVADAAGKYPGDIDKAVTTAVNRIRKLKEYEEIRDALFLDAVRSLVHTARHDNNRQLKLESGGYGKAPKVIVASSPLVNSISLASYYNYALGGRSLGEYTREELENTAQNEAKIAEGHLFNVRLCRTLVPKVPKGKTVREAIKNAALKRIFADLLQSGDGLDNVA